MSYTLNWKTPSIPGKDPINVPVGTVVSSETDVALTGKGTANYGALQQQNMMWMLEHFASPTAPTHPTVGQLWFNSTTELLNICLSVSPVIWKSLAGVEISSSTPLTANLGDLWFHLTGSSTGALYVYTGLGRFPDNGSEIGGWNQIWPNVHMFGGREEYDFVNGMVNQILGDAVSFGGNGAITRAITNLTDFSTLDVDMQTKWATFGSDTNVLTPSSESTAELLVNPNSNDWDTLLAAAKYAVNRLELPTGFTGDISPVPFVFDGAQAPSSLTTLSTSDVRYPSIERRSSRELGMITMMRLYTETVNVITAAVSNRYSLKGINGSSGTNTTFDSSVSVYTQRSFSAPMSGNQTGSISLGFVFANDDELLRFLNSGCGIQITISHVPGGSGTTADTNLETLLAQRGVLRLTADKTRTFGNSLPLYLATTPVSVGVKGAASGGTTLVTHTLSGATFTVSAATGNVAGRFDVSVSFDGGGVMQGTMTVLFEVISSVETYSGGYVYPHPTSYVSGQMSSTGPTFS